MYLQKVIRKKLYFVGVLKVSDENSRTRSRFRIHESEARIRTKMSRIRNNASHTLIINRLLLVFLKRFEDTVFKIISFSFVSFCDL
jgi:hypothetical protein